MTCFIAAVPACPSYKQGDHAGDSVHGADGAATHLQKFLKDTYCQ
jgi:hypothetical protein